MLWLCGFAFLAGFVDSVVGGGGLIQIDFLRASASAKAINLATNLSAVGYFAATDRILYGYAVPMGPVIFSVLFWARGWRCGGATGLCAGFSWSWWAF